ncbi:MAG TPA: carbohydrate ABC transporter permease [Thermodesulfobacteriota bacterium]|nr:carbohydrate ABC transporter permease [Thermodesulfobacteriota bacterium]
MRPRGRAAVSALLALLVAAVALFPFLWQVRTSVLPDRQLYAVPVEWWPEIASLAEAATHYRRVFALRPFHRNLLNSAVVAAWTTANCLVLGALAAFVLARLRVRGGQLWLALVLAVALFPPVVTLSPLYLVFQRLGLLNTYPALVLPYTTFALPLTLWILTAFFRQIPRELTEAALVDGCSPLSALVRVVLPLAAPGLAAAALLVFIYSWNELLFALAFTFDDRARPVTAALALFPGERETPWGEVAAASVIVTLPLVALVLVAQRRIVAGLTAGALKG